jgi:hypothetical protein
MPKPNLFDPSVGLLRIGKISPKGYNTKNNKVYIELNDGGVRSPNPDVEVNLPLGLFYNNGICIGTLPEPGTPVIIGQGIGDEYFFVSFAAGNINLTDYLKPGEL